MIHNAEIIAIGSELLSSERMDTNSLYLTGKLNSIGIEVELKTVVGDNESRLESVIREALRRSSLVVSSGGLGPTEDDITKKVFARVLKRQLVLENRVLERIQTRFRNRGLEMSANNARQALVQAIDFDPELAVAYERLGYCQFRMRNYPDALANYEQANTLDPDNSSVQTGLGVVQMALYLQDQSKLEMRQIAIEHWHRSLELNPNQPKIHHLVDKYQIPQDRTTAILMDAPLE